MFDRSKKLVSYALSYLDTSSFIVNIYISNSYELRTSLRTSAIIFTLTGLVR